MLSDDNPLLDDAGQGRSKLRLVLAGLVLLLIMAAIWFMVHRAGVSTSRPAINPGKPVRKIVSL